MKIAAQEKITFAPYDPAEYIDSKEIAIAYLEGALEQNDPDFFIRTIGHIARSKGMSLLAKELNLDRGGLYKSFTEDGNPSFRTVFNLLTLLGLQIKVEPRSA